MRLSERIREHRKWSGFTLKDLADKTGLSASYLSDIERGRTDPSIKTLDRLCEAFSTTLPYLLTGVDRASFDFDSLPTPLQEFGYDHHVSDEWLDLLDRIHIDGIRPQSAEDYLEIYLHLRRVLEGAK